MIGSGPNYLNQYHNPNLIGGIEQAPYMDLLPGQNLNQESPAALSQAERLEMERIKAEYAKRARVEEMVEIARTMEHFRTRLLMIDLQVQANLVDEVIRDLVNKWNAERG